MTLRFRKSIRIAPGIRINFSKKGVSASIGGAPLTMNISRDGVRGTVSAPGTGLSASNFVGFTDLKSHVDEAPAQIESVADPEPSVWRDAFARTFWIVGALFILFSVISMVSSSHDTAPASAPQPEAAEPQPPQDLPPPHKKKHK